MFIASKYEDQYPIRLQTVFEKIGHSKLSKESIVAKEADILQTLGFKIGGAPTVLEFLEQYFESIPQLANHTDKLLLKTIAIYLSKMSLYHGDLYQKLPSQLGAASIFVANKIYEQMITLSRKQQKNWAALSEKFLLEVLSNPVSQADSPLRTCQKLSASKCHSDLISLSKRLLSLAQNFEQEMPGLKHLQSIYLPKLEEMVSSA